MKKMVVLFIGAVFCLAMTMPAAALDLSDDAAKLIHGKSTAYSPQTINAVLETMGLKLTADAAKDVPATYASVSGDEVSFRSKSTAFSPDVFHGILTAYGLTLSPEAVKDRLGSTNYAKVSGDNIVFGKKPAAYGGETLKAILGAYEVPGGVAAAPATSTPTPTPAPTPTPTPAAPTDVDGDGVPDSQDACPGTPAGANIDKRGCWVLQQDYLFDFDKATIKVQYRELLDDVVTIMNSNPSLKVQLEGHTDSIGSQAYNQRLSERRAKAVMNYLIQKGINPSFLSTIGYGEDKPVATNATKEGRAQNRRVELTPIW